MLFNSAVALLVGVSQVSAAVGPRMASESVRKILAGRDASDVFGITPRQDSYIPTLHDCTGGGTTCAQACGVGSRTCRSTDVSLTCFRPSEGEICCPDGNSCSAGYVCAAYRGVTYCCQEGVSLPECARQYGVAKVTLQGVLPTTTSTTTRDPTPDPTPDPIPEPTPDPIPDPIPDTIPDTIPDPIPEPTTPTTFTTPTTPSTTSTSTTSTSTTSTPDPTTSTSTTTPSPTTTTTPMTSAPSTTRNGEQGTTSSDTTTSTFDPTAIMVPFNAAATAQPVLVAVALMVFGVLGALL